MEKVSKKQLREAEIFSTLGNDELRCLKLYSEFESFKKGDIILEEGDICNSLYLIESGKIEIAKTDKWEGSTLIAELVEGDILGELEFFTGTPFSTTAYAEEETTLLRIPGKNTSFDEILNMHPEVAAKMLYQFLKIFSSRLRNANTLVKDNSVLVQELKRQVYGDKLTGLYNKTYLEETLPDLLAKTDSSVALLLMKPDNFKMINDTFGHEAGDDTLKIMAAELNNFVGENGTVLRYMGNELGVILENSARDDSLEMAKAILKMFNELDISAATGAGNVFLSMSIGVALYPEHANISDELIFQAHDLPLVGRARGGNLILFPEDKSGKSL